MILFVQPFGVASPGGGPRILRALLSDAPMPWVSVGTTPGIPPPPMQISGGTELHLPIRPHLGRIEQTRFCAKLYPLERVYAASFVRRLVALCKAQNVRGIHGVAHGMDYWYSFLAAQQLKLPYYLSVHDDLAFALSGRPEYREGMAHLPQVWQQAAARFVISEEMGQEYCRRYGVRPYQIVTDGLTEVPDTPLIRTGQQLRIYFMGLFHRSYIPNLRTLLEGLAILRRQHPDWEMSVTCRCGQVPAEALTGDFPVIELPFGSEKEVAHDMEAADLLYLPLPFEGEYASFVKFSLSTKMISYLGSGLPIIYHGPADAAAGALLARHDAAWSVHSRDPEVLAKTLTQARADTGRSVVCRALALAREQFLLKTQRERFWGMYR